MDREKFEGTIAAHLRRKAPGMSRLIRRDLAAEIADQLIGRRPYILPMWAAEWPHSAGARSEIAQDVQSMLARKGRARNEVEEVMNDLRVEIALMGGDLSMIDEDELFKLAHREVITFGEVDQDMIDHIAFEEVMRQMDQRDDRWDELEAEVERKLYRR